MCLIETRMMMDMVPRD